MSLTLKPGTGQLPIPGSKLKQDLDRIESELQKLAATMPNVNPATRFSPTQYSSWGAETSGFLFAPPGPVQSPVYTQTQFGSIAILINISDSDWLRLQQTVNKIVANNATLEQKVKTLSNQLGSNSVTILSETFNSQAEFTAYLTRYGVFLSDGNGRPTQEKKFDFLST